MRGSTPSTSQRAAQPGTTTPVRGRRERDTRVQALPAVTSAVQDAIVGGAVFAAIGAAAWAGGRGDPSPCGLCAGTGGCSCFACGASGVSEAGARAASAAADASPPRPTRRDPLGRVPPPPGQCRVCGGTGLVLCSSCRGSGYKNL